MRKILFRGKTDTGRWIYGDLLQIPKADTYSIMGQDKLGIIYEIDKNTIGQYTGLKDCNGKEIYEGDIIKSKEYGRQQGDKNFSGYDIYEVRFVDGSFVIRNSDRLFYLLRGADKEVIGNIHDNPELLEGVRE